MDKLNFTDLFEESYYAIIAIIVLAVAPVIAVNAVPIHFDKTAIILFVYIVEILLSAIATLLLQNEVNKDYNMYENSVKLAEMVNKLQNDNESLTQKATEANAKCNAMINDFNALQKSNKSNFESTEALTKKLTCVELENEALKKEATEFKSVANEVNGSKEALKKASVTINALERMLKDAQAENNELQHEVTSVKNSIAGKISAAIRKERDKQKIQHV